MNNFLRNTTFSVFLLLLATTSFSQADSTDCSIMYNGVFKDVNDIDKTAKIEITDKWMYDYSKNESEYIKSEIEWITDCKYVITLVETNMDDLPIPIGTRLKVEILEVENDTITYQYLPAGVMKPRKLIKIE